jgi:CTP-dependent riboflavin kinase
MKRKEKPADILRTFLYRNNKEQELPEGYIGKEDLKKRLMISENQFARIVPELVKRKEIDRIVRKRVKDGRIYKMSFFKLSGYLVKVLKV